MNSSRIFEPAVVRTSLVQNRSLMPSGMPSSGPPSPFRKPRVRRARHVARVVRRLLHEGIERARGFDRADMGVGQLERGDVFLAQTLAGLGERQRGQVGHDQSQMNLFFGSVFFSSEGECCRIRIVPSGCSSR